MAVRGLDRVCCFHGIPGFIFLNHKAQFRHRIYMVRKTFQTVSAIIAIAASLATGLLSVVSLQAVYSGNLGLIFIGAMLLAYLLGASYVGSLMMVWISYWELPFWLFMAFGLISAGTFLVMISGIPFFASVGVGGAIAFIIPYLLYIFAISRLGLKAFRGWKQWAQSSS